MKTKQLSLFLENKPGHLSSVCRTLSGAGINILTLSMADTQQFGILRIIVRDWEKAKSVLEKAGNAVNVTEVLAIEISDRPGGLAEVLDVIENAEINLEYMYAFAVRSGEKAIMFFRFDNPDTAVQALEKTRINVVGPVELFNLAEG
jgi:hypothetical protein